MERRYLIGEVDVPWGVNEVQDIVLALVLVVHAEEGEQASGAEPLHVARYVQDL